MVKHIIRNNAERYRDKNQGQTLEKLPLADARRSFLVVKIICSSAFLLCSAWNLLAQRNICIAQREIWLLSGIFALLSGRFALLSVKMYCSLEQLRCSAWKYNCSFWHFTCLVKHSPVNCRKNNYLVALFLFGCQDFYGWQYQIFMSPDNKYFNSNFSLGN